VPRAVASPITVDINRPSRVARIAAQEYDPDTSSGGGSMRTQLNPYLNFRDNTREAMEFYQSVFGGKLDMMTFKEYNASEDPSEDDKIMHSVLEADGMTFMAADTPNSMEYSPGTNFNMSLSGDDEAALRGYFDKLQVGGTVMMPLEKAPWGDTFGMLIDRFGVRWLVNISQAEG
jgi:PhnB protein